MMTSLRGGCLRSYDSLLDDYKQAWQDPPLQRKTYHLLLSDLCSGIIEGNIKLLQSVCKVLLAIGGIESNEKLLYFFHDPSNPFAGTNVIILSCKLSQHDVLAYFLNEDDKVLVKLYQKVGLAMISPEIEDSSKHTAFYYAIRSNQVKTVELLIEKWPGCKLNQNEEKLNDILSQSYGELKLKNVNICFEMEICIEGKLIGIQYLSSSRSEDGNSNTKTEEITARVDFLMEKIETFLKEQPLSADLILFGLKSIARSIHFIKNALKPTYSTVPWEEIEFCVVSYIISNSNHEKLTPVYKWILNLQKLKDHLKNFLVCIKQERHILVGKYKNDSLIPNLKRQKVVDTITRKYPDLINLFKDYERLRDLKSLDIIRHYVTLSEKADPEDQNGKLVIVRMIQMLVECLKNTLESPKMSEGMSKLLLSCTHKPIRNLLLEFRSSPPGAVRYMVDIEEEADESFFLALKESTQNMKTVIEEIFNYETLKVIRSQLKVLENCKNFHAIGDILDILHLCELDHQNCFLKNADYYKSLIEGMTPEKLDQVLSPSQIILLAKSNESFISMMLSVTSLLEGSSLINRVLVLPTTSEMLSEGSEVTLCRMRSWAKTIHKEMFGAAKNEKALGLGDDFLKLLDTLALRCTTSDYLDVFKKVFEIVQLVTFFLNTESAEEIVQKFSRHNNLFPLESRGYPIQININTEKNVSRNIADLKRIMSSTDNDTISKLKNDPVSVARLELLVLDLLRTLHGQNCLSQNFSSVECNVPILVGERLLHHLEHADDISYVIYNPITSLVLNSKELFSKNLHNFRGQIGTSSIIAFPELKEIEDEAARKVRLQYLLFHVLCGGDLNEVKPCIENGADIAGRSIYGTTTAHYAAVNPDESGLAYILLNHYPPLEMKNCFGETALHYAAKHGHASLLLLETIPVDVVDNFGRTPLHLSAGKGNIKAIEILLSKGADANRIDNEGNTPFKWALFNGHTSSCKAILREQILPSSSALDLSFFLSPLHLAAEIGSVDILSYILEGGFVPSNYQVPNPLFFSAQNGHLEVTQLLLANKFEVNSKNYYGETPLHCAVSSNHREVVKLLLLHGANVNMTDNNGSTPLIFGAVEGNAAIVRMLLKKKARIDVQQKGTLKTPLHWAVQKKHQNVLKLLLEYSISPVNAQDSNGLTPLHYAVLVGDFESTDILVKHGARVDTKNCKGQTAMLIAAEYGFKHIVAFLLKNGANVNVADHSGTTPLNVSAQNGRSEVVEILLDSGAQVVVQTKDSQAPLLAASLSGNVECVRLLLRQTRLVDSTDASGCTALHMAASLDSVDIMKCLIEEGANVNHKNVLGFTPLHMACFGGSVNAAKLLIERGSNVDDQALDGSSPLHAAVLTNSKEILALLLSKKAQRPVEALLQAVASGFAELLAMLLDFYPKAVIDDYNLIMASCSSFGNISRDKIVEVLIQKGADVNLMCPSFKGWWRLLHFAASENNLRTLQILIANGGNPNLKDSAQELPLHKAAKAGHLKAVMLLLSHSPDVMKKEENANTLLASAIANGQVNVVKLFLNHSDKLDVRTLCKNSKWPLLHMAAESGKVSVVKMLVEKGADINHTIDTGSKALHIAAREGFPGVVHYFLSIGMSLYDTGSGGNNLLHYVAHGMANTIDVAKMLVIEKKMDVNKINDDGLTPLLFACFVKNQISLVRFLLSHGAMYNKYPGGASLHYLDPPMSLSMRSILQDIDNFFHATKQGDLAQVQLCLLRNVPVNVRNIKNETPLLCASWKGHDEIVEMLLSNGANPNMTGKSDCTAIHYASKNSHFQIVLSLLASGAKFDVWNKIKKTPSDYTTDEKIKAFFNFLKNTFMKVRSGDVTVTRSLRKMKWESKELRAFLNCRDSNGKNLIATAILSKFPDTESIKSHLMGNTSLKNVSALISKGKIDEALSTYDIEARDFHGSLLGADCLYLISSHLAISGHHLQALSKFKELLTTFEELLGHEHQATLRVKSFMGAIMHGMGQHKEALELLREVYGKQQAFFDPLHTDLLSTQKRLSDLLCQVNKLDEALEVCSELLEKLITALGSNHHSTLRVQVNYATILTKQLKYSSALQISEAIVKKLTTALGRAHPDTLKAMAHVMVIHLSMNHKHDALKILLEIQKNGGIVLKPEVIMSGLNKFLHFGHQFDFSSMVKLFHEELFGANSSVDASSGTQSTLGSKSPFGGDLITTFEAIDIIKPNPEQGEKTRGKANKDSVVTVPKEKNIQYEKNGSNTSLEPDEERTEKMMGSLDLVMNGNQNKNRNVESSPGAEEQESHDKNEEENEISSLQEECISREQRGEEMALVMNGNQNKNKNVESSPGAEEQESQGKNEEENKISSLQEECVSHEQRGEENNYHVEGGRKKNKKKKKKKKKNDNPEPGEIEGVEEDCVPTVFDRESFEEGKKNDNCEPDGKKSQEGSEESGTILGEQRCEDEKKKRMKKKKKKNNANAEPEGGKFREDCAISDEERCEEVQKKDSTNPEDSVYSPIPRSKESLDTKDVLRAISARDVAIVTRMLESGFDFNAQDEAGRTPLHFAVSSGNIEMVAQLIKNGANVSIMSKRKNTVFHLAANSGNNELMELLIKNIDENDRDHSILNRATSLGMTALHLAASKGHSSVVETLLKNGAQFNVFNRDNKTPLDVSASGDVTSVLTRTAHCFTTAEESIEALRKLDPACTTFLNARRNDNVPLRSRLEECKSLLDKYLNQPDEDEGSIL